MNNIFIKNTHLFIFLFIVFVSIALRFYQLGNNPPSIDWDEASIGYNAYSLLKTGKDEYGSFLPLSIRSFDDYKPPLYVYLTIPSVALFGLTEFAVRFPSAVIGILAVVVTYFLVKELLSGWDNKKKEYTALLSAFFLAISPWHLQFSRAAFEGNIGLFFFILGIFLFLKGIKNNRFLLLASISFVGSFYAYHSFRLLAPLMLGVLGILFWKELLKKKTMLLLSFGIFILCIIPVYLSFSPQGSGARLSMVTVFSSEDILKDSIFRIEQAKRNNDPLGMFLANRRALFGLAVAKGYLDHFDPVFLFLTGDGGVQHHAVDMGMLYLWELPFILWGMHVLLNRLNRYTVILFAILFLSAFPSSFTTGTPHPVRAIGMLVALHAFTAIGVVIIVQKLLAQKKVFFRGIILGIFFLLLANFAYYIYQYYVRTPVVYGYFWQYGYKEIVVYAKEHENQFDSIIITYKYDQPYIYYLFYNKIDPAWYQKNWDYNENGQIDRFRRKIGKYDFRNINYPTDSKLKKTLLIGTPEEIPSDAKVEKEVLFPDGRVAFKVVRT